MKLKAWHWLAALIFSVSTHLFAASFMQATPEDVLIEGGGAGSVVLLGMLLFLLKKQKRSK